MKWNIDPSFDPLQDLQEAKEDIAFLKNELFQLQGNFHRLVESHNAQGNLLRQLTDQNTQMLQSLNWVNGFREKRL